MLNNLCYSYSAIKTYCKVTNSSNECILILISILRSYMINYINNRYIDIDFIYNIINGYL